MPISNRSDCLRWPRSDGATSRTAVYGPVRTVVWQGSAGNRCPYADQIAKSLTTMEREPHGRVVALSDNSRLYTQVVFCQEGMTGWADQGALSPAIAS